MSISALADMVAEATGLSRSACSDLLRKGWTFERKLDQPDAWVSPSAQRAKVSMMLSVS